MMDEGSSPLQQQQQLRGSSSVHLSARVRWRRRLLWWGRGFWRRRKPTCCAAALERPAAAAAATATARYSECGSGHGCHISERDKAPPAGAPHCDMGC